MRHTTMTVYDATGRTYALTRRPDPRIADAIDAALHGMATVLNVGAGTGSYEPSRTVLAVEPSRVMIAQRPDDAAPAVRATAEHLPARTDSVDAALAVLTIHHWTGLERGLAEMARVARRRIAILTWDHAVFRRFWLVRDYLPAAAETDARLAVSLDRLTAVLKKPAVQPIPVPHDCVDGFGGAYWRRPEAYLDETVRAGMSMLALTPEPLLRQGLAWLRRDLATGAWHTRYADLSERSSLDLGYRLVTVDLAN
ncbi:methyltransferase family protein [Nocardia tenerifensis]|uniref:Methyltransferase family protein n=1 Tax=Nocardia tenerifensis TaxID=228006 RepID=A0A318JND0_9NOCA|nr:class I SAM-dependent methyltransferase [Nocardia tenerifensis]PXX52838.1 methyltransferase family protein [Nocardia tenerifensis]